MKFILLSDIICNGKKIKSGFITELKEVPKDEIKSLLEVNAIAEFDEKKLVEEFAKKSKKRNKKVSNEEEIKDQVTEEINDVAKEIDKRKAEEAADEEIEEDINDTGIEVIKKNKSPVNTSKKRGKNK